MVDSIEEFYAKLKGYEVSIIDGIRDTQWGARILLFKDPYGNILQATEIGWDKYFKSISPG